MGKQATSQTKFWRKPASIVATILFVLFLVSEIVVYSLATQPGLRQGPKQIIHDLPLRKLSDGHTLGQTFEIDPYQFIGLELWLDPPTAAPANASLNAAIYAFEFKRDIASITLPVTSIKKDQPLQLQFPHVDAGSWPSGQPMTIQLILTTKGISEADPIIGLGSANRYSNGIAVYDDRQRPKEDLAFAALYHGNALDMIMPITRLAEARPGVFGWPPLYALLVCATFWLLLGLVIMVAWPRSPKQALPA